MSDLVLNFLLPAEVVVEGGGDVRAFPVRVLPGLDASRCTVVLGKRLNEGALDEGFEYLAVEVTEAAVSAAIEILQARASEWMAETARRKKMLRGW